MAAKRTKRRPIRLCRASDKALRIDIDLHLEVATRTGPGGEPAAQESLEVDGPLSDVTWTCAGTCTREVFAWRATVVPFGGAA